MEDNACCGAVPLQKGERACVVGVQGLCACVNFAGGLKQQKPGFGHRKKVVSDFFFKDRKFKFAWFNLASDAECALP